MQRVRSQGHIAVPMVIAKDAKPASSEADGIDLEGIKMPRIITATRWRFLKLPEDFGILCCFGDSSCGLFNADLIGFRKDVLDDGLLFGCEDGSELTV